jgi:hypothetical protein
VSDIPSRNHDAYPQWVRQAALSAAAQVVAGQITDRTHVKVTIKRMEQLIPWAETYLKTGGFPPSDR